MKLNIYNWPYVDDQTPGGRHAETAEELIAVMRDLRDVLLKECDWTIVPDSPLTEERKQEWILWRQWMRDLPNYCSPQDGDKWVEILDPPQGYPRSWANVTFVE